MKKEKNKVGDVIKIEWDDAFSKSGWWDKNDLISVAQNIKPITSIGMLVFESDKWLILALSNSNDKTLREWGHICGILKSSIIKITKII